MKSVLCASGCALISFLCAAPVSALTVEPEVAVRSSSRLSAKHSSEPGLGSLSEPLKVAGVFDILTEAIKVTTGAMEMVHQQKQRDHALQVEQAKEQERQERLALERRLQEQEYEHKVALAKLQFREAERRRQEYLNLEEAERAAYLADQRSRQEVEAILFLGLIGGLAESNSLIPATAEASALNGVSAEMSLAK